MSTVLSNAWILKRRPYWERLDLLAKTTAATGLKSLSRDELRETVLLYRQVAADLSVLRQDKTARNAADYVNQILARSHHLIYSQKKANWRGLWLFFRDEYPRVFQAQLGYVVTALLVSLAFGALGAVVTASHPEFIQHALPASMIATMERHEMWTKSVVSVAPAASSQIMTNNLSVCFVTFVGGITFGFLTLYSMINNGLMLGVVGMACHQYGMSLQLWSFIAAHGSLELPSIFIAGGAGFRLGSAMLFPGKYRWRDSVAKAGADASRLVAGTIPLLVIAGTLEGFLSPSAAPIWIKFTVGGILFTLLNLWLFHRVEKPVAA